MKGIEIEAELLAVSEDASVTFSAIGKSGVVRLSNIHAKHRTLKLLPLMIRANTVIKTAHRLCVAQKLALQVEVAGQTVLRIGSLSNPGLFSRVLGVYPAELRMWPLCVSMLGKQSS
ncbi:hypothetical protein BH10CYA1_BH10CYA1_27740 [soil metagenome]